MGLRAINARLEIPRYKYRPHIHSQHLTPVFIIMGGRNKGKETQADNGNDMQQNQVLLPHLQLLLLHPQNDNLLPNSKSIETEEAFQYTTFQRFAINVGNRRICIEIIGVYNRLL
ncbi:hypothetical protein LguiA_008210 [Lonicera macranthoides]